MPRVVQNFLLGLMLALGFFGAPKSAIGVPAAQSKAPATRDFRPAKVGVVFGEQYDPDLGLYYLRARFYNPQTGRMWTVDSYEGRNSQPASLHKYLYVHGNPINGIDPSGHEFSLSGTMSAVSTGFRISTKVASSAYALKDKAEWMKDGVTLLNATITRGRVDPVALGFWMSDFIPIGKIAGKIGRVTGIGNHLSQVRNSLVGIGNKAKEQLGMLAASAVARAKGFKPTRFTPRGNGGFDGLYRDGDYFVIMESKFGRNPRLNPSSGTNPSQMSREWIRKNIDDLERYDPTLAKELETAFGAGKIKGIVVKTRVDAGGNVLDPEFELKDLNEIGIGTWDGN